MAFGGVSNKNSFLRMLFMALCFCVHAEELKETVPQSHMQYETKRAQLLADGFSHRATINEQDDETRLFDFYQKELRSEDQLTRVNHYIEISSGEDMLRETVVTSFDGTRLYRYEVEQLQMDEKGNIELDHDKKRVMFKYFKNKKWREKTEKLDEDAFLVGPMVPDFIMSQKSRLVANEKIRFSLAVPYMTQSLTFRLEEEENNPDEAFPLTVYKMSPTNFLVSAAVRPLLFEYKKDSNEIQSISGRHFLKKRTSSGSWDAFQGQTHFFPTVRTERDPKKQKN